MTCKEKLQIEHPECVNVAFMGGVCGCPCDYKYLPSPPDCDATYQTCERCWNREIPDTESTKSNTQNDSVNHPNHYTHGGIECIDAMEAAFGAEWVEHFCACNAFKYIFRFLHKNGLEDIDKAIWYLNKYKELESEKVDEEV
jgi:hypothetical protein